jgi:predicted HD phosphohydrolase
MSIDLLICSYHHELLDIVSMIKCNFIHKCTSMSSKLINLYFGMLLFQPCKVHDVPFSSDVITLKIFDKNRKCQNHNVTLHLRVSSSFRGMNFLKNQKLELLD